MDTLKKLVAIIVLILSGLAPLTAQERARESDEDEESRAALERQIQEYERQVGEAARKLVELHAQLSRVEARQRLAVPRPTAGGRPMLGVVVKTEADEESDALGATLQAITPGGPAEEAGLRPGDVVVKFKGRPIAGPHPEAEEGESPAAVRLIDLARGLKEGEKVTVEYLRGEDRRTVTLTARRLRRAHVSVPVNVEIDPEKMWNLFIGTRAPLLAATEIPGRWMDVEMVSVNPDLGEYFKTDHGVLVVRAPEDEALKIKGGDVILKIGEADLVTPTQAVRLLRAHERRRPITMSVIRKGDLITLTAEPPEPPPPPDRAPRPPRPPRPSRHPEPDSEERPAPAPPPEDED